MHTKANDLSGGLARRLSLALELLADREILFLGEGSDGRCHYSSEGIFAPPPS